MNKNHLCLTHVVKFLTLAEVPDAPQAPVVKEIYKDTALISWLQPADGGKPITNYIVERKETKANMWSRAGKDRIYPNTEYWVPDLLKGCEYEFRVMAENVIGIGDPSPPSKPIYAKDPIGMRLMMFSMRNVKFLPSSSINLLFSCHSDPKPTCTSSSN